ncbi:MAG: hypothetical protein QOE92_365 [Chloroflexota bacterium]|nr:hypothetical protein [Chloroflexota bacterium]
MNLENGTSGTATVRDAEGARSRPLGETTATTLRPAQRLLVDVGHFDLAAESTRLILEARASATGRSSKTLVKLPHLHLTLTAAKAGTRLEDHSTQAPAAILALVGTFRIQVGDQTLRVGPQQAVSLVPNLKHAVEAIEDCAFLLTLG